jgi:hypothetical protein
MNVRSWAVAVGSTTAMVAGVVAVQSGISGTAALPILPDRAAAPAAPAGGAELSAPAETSVPPPGAGTVRQATVVHAAAMPQPRSAAHRNPASADRPDRRSRPSGDGSDDRSGTGDGHDGSGKDSGSSSGSGSGSGSGHDSRGRDGPG